MICVDQADSVSTAMHACITCSAV